MKKNMILSGLGIAILMFMVGCEELDPVEKHPKQIILNKKAAEIVKADQQFAFEIFHEVSKITEEDNIMISPLSISYALGMTYNGAAGSTLDAFNNVLHFQGLTNEEVNESYKDLMDQLVNLDEKVEFSIANSIWYREGFTCEEEFLNTNKTYFDAVVEALDFSDPASVDIINNWIEEKTNDKIQDMLDVIPPDAFMYLVNAIYFNAKWHYQFDPEDTMEKNFYLANGETHKADFMKVNGTFNYTTQNNFRAVELPYGDSTFSMVVMLPETNITTDELISEMDIDAWQSWFSDSRNTNVQVELPKFKFEFKELLNDPLTDLGLGVAFSDNADFSKIRPEKDLFISRVIHQSFIDVKEEGTEAAAATAVEISLTSVGEPGPVMFIANRPFLFVIKENSTGLIVFVGKVGKP